MASFFFGFLNTGFFLPDGASPPPPPLTPWCGAFFFWCKTSQRGRLFPYGALGTWFLSTGGGHLWAEFLCFLGGRAFPPSQRRWSCGSGNFSPGSRGLPDPLTRKTRSFLVVSQYTFSLLPLVWQGLFLPSSRHVGCLPNVCVRTATLTQCSAPCPFPSLAGDPLGFAPCSLRNSDWADR